MQGVNGIDAVCTGLSRNAAMMQKTPSGKTGPAELLHQERAGSQLGSELVTFSG